MWTFFEPFLTIFEPFLDHFWTVFRPYFRPKLTQMGLFYFEMCLAQNVVFLSIYRRYWQHLSIHIYPYINILTHQPPLLSPPTHPPHLQNGGCRPTGTDLIVHTDTAAVAETALRSLNYHSGILFLEELLVVAERIHHAPAKGQGAKAGGEDWGVYGGVRAVWRQLSALYGSLGENDILLGLAEKVSSRARETREAIDAEVSGNHRLAIVKYGALLEAAAAQEERGRGGRGGRDRDSGWGMDSQDDSADKDNAMMEEDDSQ